MTYGGHRAAAGLSILPEQIDAFRDAFERHAEALLTPELLAPVERVDAVVSGADLSLDLAEELLALAPFGQGNPDVRLYLAGATFDGVRTMGDSGQHVRFNVNSGGVRASAVAFGCDGRVAGADGAARSTPASSSSATSGTASSSHAWSCNTRPRACHAEIVVLGEPDDYLTAAFMELDRDLDSDFADDPDLASESEAALLAELDQPATGQSSTAGARVPLRPSPTLRRLQVRNGRVLVICANTPAATRSVSPVAAVDLR